MSADSFGLLKTPEIYGERTSSGVTAANNNTRQSQHLFTSAAEAQAQFLRRRRPMAATSNEAASAYGDDDDNDNDDSISFAGTQRTVPNGAMWRNQTMAEINSMAGSQANLHSEYFLLVPENELAQAQDQAALDMKTYEDDASEWLSRIRQQQVYFNEKKTQYYETVFAQAKMSQVLMEKHEAAFMPYNAVNIEPVTLSIVPLVESKNDGTFVIHPFDCVPPGSTLEERLAIFGSVKHYMQGFDVPLLKKRGGDITNTFVLKIGRAEYINQLGYCIGVRISHAVKKNNKMVNVYFTNMREVWPGTKKRYHDIIWPGKTKKPDKLHSMFVTDETINSQYSQNFPGIKADEALLRKGIQPLGINKVLVPINHPVAHYIASTRAYYKVWEPLKKYATTEESLEGMYEVSRQVCEISIKALSHLILSSMPIVDVSTLRFEFEVLGVNVKHEEMQRRMKDFGVKEREPNNAAFQFGFKAQIFVQFCEHQTMQDDMFVTQENLRNTFETMNEEDGRVSGLQS